MGKTEWVHCYVHICRWETAKHRDLLEQNLKSKHGIGAEDGSQTRHKENGQSGGKKDQGNKIIIGSDYVPRH
jgi:hypothetical protein